MTWHRAATGASDALGPAVRLCLAPSGKVAAALTQEGVTAADVQVDLSRGVVLRRASGDGLFELAGSRYQLLLARGTGRLSGAPIAFIRALGQRDSSDGGAVWTPEAVSIHHPREEPSCDPVRLLEYQREIAEKSDSKFRFEEQPRWLADRNAIAQSLALRYIPLRRTLQTLRHRSGLEGPEPVAGRVSSIAAAKLGPAPDSTGTLIAIEVDPGPDPDARDEFSQGTRVEIFLAEGDERSSLRMARAAVHLDAGGRLWLKCADEHSLDVGDQVTVKAFVQFDKRNHLYALDRLLDGQVAGEWAALSAMLLDRSALAPLDIVAGKDPTLHPDLDDDQRRAVLGALKTPHAFWIQGPPGTGKTTVIAEIIKQATARGDRVLMVAPQHVAVDNVLDKLEDAEGVLALRLAVDALDVDSAHRDKLSPDPARFGRAVLYPESRRGQFIDPRWPEDRRTCVKELRDLWFDTLADAERADPKGREGVVERVGEQLVGCVNLVCSTSTGVGGHPVWRDREFDVMILDEASRATETEFLVGAIRSKRWIVVGDEKQLPPFVNQTEEHHVHALLSLRRSDGSAEDERLIPAVDNLALAWDEELPERRFRQRSVCEYARWLVDRGHWPECSAELESLIRSYGPEERDPEQQVLRTMIGGLQQSLFERCVTDGLCPPSLMQRLTQQRRSVPQIAEIVNGPVYGGRYRTASDLKVTPLIAEPFNAPVAFIDTASYGHQAMESPKGTGFVNELEQRLTLISLRAIARALRDQGQTASVSILSTYKAQADAIVNRLLDSGFIHPTRVQAESASLTFELIDAIDRIQGQESDIVVLSLCRATNTRPHPGYGLWLQDMRRLNVAVTRAKRALVVIGHSPTLLALGGAGSRASAFFAHLLDLTDGSPGYIRLRSFGK